MYSEFAVTVEPIPTVEILTIGAEEITLISFDFPVAISDTL